MLIVVSYFFKKICDVICDLWTFVTSWVTLFNISSRKYVLIVILSQLFINKLYRQIRCSNQIKSNPYQSEWIEFFFWSKRMFFCLLSKNRPLARIMLLWNRQFTSLYWLIRVCGFYNESELAKSNKKCYKEINFKH